MIEDTEEDCVCGRERERKKEREHCRRRTDPLDGREVYPDRNSKNGLSHKSRNAKVRADKSKGNAIYLFGKILSFSKSG